ncbi:MAG: hypothetical protein DRN88_00140 [Candidatus Hydrothermarchaeota archaeon]|nr:MAG: hypothetical protein DRN88_00140 [Candidatus Hydrothermarchaeota archaeon]
MNTITFLMLVLLGISLVSLSFFVFENLKESQAKVSARESLNEITSYVASVVVDAYEQANKNFFTSETQPVVNISINLPRKVGGKRYYVKLEGDNMTVVGNFATTNISSGIEKIFAETADGVVQSYSFLPYNLTGGGEIDSFGTAHYVQIFRFNDTLVVIIT